MNILKQILKLLGSKAGLICGVLVLWVLDDVLMFLPDKAVWFAMKALLGFIGWKDRVEGLRTYWTGTTT